VDVIVIHTDTITPAISDAVTTLRNAFECAPSQGSFQARFILLRDEHGRPLIDVETPGAARSAFKASYSEIRAGKLAGRKIHFSIAGGRKTMALFGLTAAQLLFDEDDRLWYLFSGGDFLASKRMHPAPGDDVSLVPVPVIRWSGISPMLSELRDIEDPFGALKRVEELRLREKFDAARTFILGSLTPAERRVVEILVKEGLSDQEIGERLFLSPRTVEQHIRSAYSKAAAHWEVANVNRAQLVGLLQLYFAARLGENPHDTD
jgi:CRISPR-associated protein Csx14